MKLVWKIVFRSILEIFYTIPFWHLPYRNFRSISYHALSAPSKETHSALLRQVLSIISSCLMFLWFGYQTDFGKTEVAKNGLQVTERQAVLKLQGERVPPTERKRPG